ncbi:hypothetical protein MTO96_007181 [Rhipicephalus appendiculatus]
MSRRLDCVETENATLESGFLGVVNTTDAGNWEATVLVQGQPVDFKIGTGANETVLPTPVFKTLKDRPLLSAPLRQLYGPDEKLLPAAGVAQLELTYRNRATTQDIYVLNQICTPLLGKPAIKKIQMLSFVNAVADKCEAERISSGVPRTWRAAQRTQDSASTRSETFGTQLLEAHPNSTAREQSWNFKGCSNSVSYHLWMSRPSGLHQP